MSAPGSRPQRCSQARPHSLAALGVADGDGSIRGRQRGGRRVGVAGDILLAAVAVRRLDDHTGLVEALALGVDHLGGRGLHRDARQRRRRRRRDCIDRI